MESLDPHTREDITKFQEKLTRIDKNLDLQSKVLMGANLDYYAIRDEFVALSDKAKALEQTYNCLNEQFKNRVNGEDKSWKKANTREHHAK